LIDVAIEERMDIAVVVVEEIDDNMK